VVRKGGIAVDAPSRTVLTSGGDAVGPLVIQSIFAPAFRADSRATVALIAGCLRLA